MEELKIGVIGTGYASHLRCNAIKKINNPRIKLIGVISKNEKHARAFSNEFSIDCFKSIREICSNKNINTILISTSNKHHKEIVINALENDKNVLCEYPLVVSSYIDAEKLIKKAREKGLFIHVGQTMNYDADVEFILQNIKRLGKLLMGYKYMSFGKLGNWFDLKQYNGSGKWYVNSDESGSWFVAAHYHGVQIFRNIFGDVHSVSAVDSSVKGTRAGTVILKHLSGAGSAIQWGMPLLGKQHNTTIISGTRGSIDIDNIDYSIKSDDYTKKGKIKEKDTFMDDTKILLEKLKGKISFESDNNDMLKSLKISFTAEKAAKNNKLLRIK